MPRLRVGVIFGGRSEEHAVSLQSAAEVLSALDPERFDVVLMGITREGKFLAGPGSLEALAGAAAPAALAPTTELAPAARRLGVDVVFPILHGPYGEDGTVQGLLELMDVPYVGSGVLGSAAAMDKGVMKALFRDAGLPVVPSRVVAAPELADPGLPRALVEELGLPLFVKPCNLGSSVGIRKVVREADLGEALACASRHDRRLIVERGVVARELECGVLGNDRLEASVVGEVIPDGEFYDYAAKYERDSKLVIPASIPEDVARRARELALAAARAVDAQGLARVDFFLVGSELFVNEINTIPGFTRRSMFPRLWERSGIPYPALCERLIDLALDRHRRRAHQEG